MKWRLMPFFMPRKGGGGMAGVRLGKKILLWMAVPVLSTTVLSGCAMSQGIDQLLRPPRLSEEQAAISAALQERVGKDIKLKYPRSGEYRSAVIIADIDEEPSKEAIVFYEKTGLGGEGIVRMNILDQKEDGKWVSVFDQSGGGTDVERVLLPRLGDGTKTTLIVGYRVKARTEKQMRAYQYENQNLSLLYSDSYAAAEVVDLDSDGENELVTITANTSDRPAMASLLKLDSEGFWLASQIGLDDTVEMYTNIILGNVKENTPALFVDAAKGDGTIQTQVLYCLEGQIKNPLLLNPVDMHATSRPAGYPSEDIDHDGIVEIPTLSPAPGYEILDSEQQLYFTDWWVFDRYGLSKKNTGYYNRNDGYCFMLPSRWQGMVTAKADTVSDEVVFYQFNGSLQDSTEELLRLRTVASSEKTRIIKEGYDELGTNGQVSYLYLVPSHSSLPLVLTETEIKFNFLYNQKP